jgi:hypothetical protein
VRLSLALRTLAALSSLAGAAVAAGPEGQPASSSTMPELPAPSDSDAPVEHAAAAPAPSPEAQARPAAKARTAAAPAPAPPPVEVTAGPAAPEFDRVADRRLPPGREILGRFEVGYRGVFVTNPGYNPFSTQDYFSGAALALSRAIVAESGFSFAPGIAWDYGSSTATARGDGATLQVHRFTVPLEGRLHAGPFGYAFIRVAPGIAGEHVEVTDSSAPSTLTKTQWLFAADASAGYALPVVPMPPRNGATFRLWLVGDAGYSWIADQRLDLTSTTPAGSPSMVNTIDLGTLSLRGAFFRVAAAVSY